MAEIAGNEELPDFRITPTPSGRKASSPPTTTVAAASDLVASSTWDLCTPTTTLKTRSARGASQTAPRTSSTTPRSPMRQASDSVGSPSRLGLSRRFRFVPRGSRAGKQERWVTHCGDASAYLGQADGTDLAGKWAEAVPAIRTDTKMSDEEWDALFTSLSKGPTGSPTAYVFRCVHCGRPQRLLGLPLTTTVSDSPSRPDA